MIDNTLKLAGLEVCRIENQRYAAFESTDICVPDSVDTAIKNKIASHRKRRTVRKRLLNIACVAAVVLLVSSAVLTVNVEARNRLVKMIRRVFGNTIEYTPNTETIKNEAVGKIKELKVNWIPEGLELIQHSENEYESMYVYTNSSDGIHIGCHILNETVSVGYISPDITNSKYEIGEYNGLYYEYIYADEYSKTNNLLIVNDIDDYYIAINSTFDKETVFKIYDSLEIVLEK